MKGLIKRLNRFEEGLLACALLGIAIFTFVETALRYTVSYTFTWFNEFANYTMIFIAYLGASIGVRYGALFSMDALAEYLPDRAALFLLDVQSFVYLFAVDLAHLDQHTTERAAFQLVKIFRVCCHILLPCRSWPVI